MRSFVVVAVLACGFALCTHLLARAQGFTPETPAASCAANTVNLTTFTVTAGVVTHC